MRRELTGILRFIGIVIASMLFAITAILSLPFNPGGRLFHANSRIWARVVLFIGGLTVRVRGLDNVPFTRNYVYVANHASMFDIPVIVASIPDQIRIVYKKELEWIPLFGWGLKWGSYIGIDRRGGSRAMQSLNEAAAKIRNGASVLLYAEGTRTRDGRLQTFKRGAFRLAVQSGVPVIPLTVNGSFHILKKHSIVVRPGEIGLVLESPIELHGLSGKEAETELMEKVHAAIRSHYVDQE